MAATVVQSATTNFVTASPTFTVSLSGVGATNSLLVVVECHNSASVSSVAATGYTWTRVSGSGTTASQCDIEFWQGIGGSGGAVTVTVTITPSGLAAGGTVFEIGGGAPGVGGSGGTGSSTTVSLNAQTVTVGNSLVFGAFAVNTGTTSSAPASPWTDVAGPLIGGSQRGGIVYQQTSSNTLATSWTISTATSYVVAAMVIPASGTSASAGVAPATAQGWSPQNNATPGTANAVAAAFSPTNFAPVGVASVAATAYAPIAGQVTLAHPTVAAASVKAFGPTNFVNAGLAFAYTTAQSPANQVSAGLAAVTATAASPIATYSVLAGVASASAGAYTLSTGSVKVSPTPTTAAAVATAYNGGLPPFSQMPLVFLEVAFNNNLFDPLASMVWTNITSYINKDISVEYGRAHALDGTSAATLEVTLNDRDGRFTPYNTSSPYYVSQTYGLVPSKPVRLYAQYGGNNYPIFYGYVDSWTTKVIDQTNQDCVLKAVDLLGILGKTYLANTTLYPNTVAQSNPIAEFRLGDFPSSTTGWNNFTLSDYTGNGGSGQIVVPSLPAASVAALPTPFYMGGQTGEFLYDINTQIALGSSSTATSAISQSQQNIQNTQQSIANDQSQITSDQTQLAADQAQLTNDRSSAQTTTSQAISDASAAYSAVGTMYSNTTQLQSEAQTTYNNSIGFANTAADANFTLTAAGVTVSAGLTANNAAGNIIGALSTLQSQGTAAAAANVISIINTALAYANTVSTDIGQMGYCFQTTQNQATSDGATNAAQDAGFGYQSVSSTAQPNAQTAIDALQTVLGDAQNAQSAWNTVASDQSQVTQDQATLAKDQATLASDEAVLSNYNSAIITTVPDTTAFVLLSPGTGVPHAGVGWFQTTQLPVSGYLGQTIALVSGSSSGTNLGTIQINQSGYVTFNFNGVPEITSGIFTNAAGNTSASVNDGNVHMVAWTLSQTGGTFSLYLDGELQGTYTNSNLQPGRQRAIGNPQILVGGTLNSSVGYIGDFIGSVQDWSLFAVPPTAAAIANLYVVGSKFQHIHTTMDRTQDVLLVALGQTAYNNIPMNILGNSLCFPEVNQLIQTTGLSYIAQVAATENGFFFQAPTATVTQYPINWVQTNPNSMTPQGIFTDNTSASCNYVVDGFQLPMDSEDLFSSIQIMQSTGADPVTDTGAPVQTAALGQFIEVTNNTSASVFGSATLQLSGILLENQVDMYFLANLLLHRYQYPIARVQGITLSSGHIANLTQMLSRGLWEQVQVQRQGPGETNFIQNSVIEHISHKINIEIPEWRTTWSLSPYELIYP